jgi:hypothetical protein
MTSNDLPPEILDLIHRHFSEADRSQAIGIVAEHRERFAWLKCIEQTQRDLVLAAEGDLSDLIRLSKMDYRDVIMEAEYQLRDGKIVRRTPPLE